MDTKNNQDMLTLGQASCLALCLPPTEENRKRAKKIFRESLFEVTYLKDANPMVPVAIGKNAKTLNPFLYNSYPETPPSSPVYHQNYPMEEEEADEAIVFFETRNKKNVVNGKEPINEREQETSNDRYQNEELDEERDDEQQQEEIVKVTTPKRRGKPVKAANIRSKTVTAAPKAVAAVPKAATTAPQIPKKFSSVAKAHLGPQKPGKFKINTPIARPRSINNNNKSKNSTAAAITANNNGNRAQSEESNGSSFSQDDSSSNKSSVSKKKVLNYLRQVLHTRIPVENEQYDTLFITSSDQMVIVKEHFDVGSLNQRQLASWIAKADFLSYPTTFKGSRGRWLYVMKKEYRDVLEVQK